MKMILCTLIFSSFAAYAAPVNYKIDTGASKVTWMGKKVTGPHNGPIAIKSGEVTFDGAKLTAGTIVIDMKSIKNDDVKDAEYNKKLVDHLNSDDFFNTSKFPEATLKVTSAKELSKGKMELTGDLTIKGKTLPITFTADVTSDSKATMAKGKMVVDRTAYDIKYGSGKFFQNLGDKMISDQFELTFEVAAKK